jgi:hypothetical protein
MSYLRDFVKRARERATEADRGPGSVGFAGNAPLERGEGGSSGNTHIERGEEPSLDRNGETSRGRATGETDVTTAARGGDGATTWPSPICAACGTTAAAVLLAMEPGLDGEAWWLCSRCWRHR